MSTKIEKWRDIISDCRVSGLPQREYCRTKNLSYPTFSYWRTKINKIDSANTGTCDNSDGFVRHALPHVGGGSSYVLEWPDGMRLRVPLHASVEDVAALTERLRKALG